MSLKKMHEEMKETRQPSLPQEISSSDSMKEESSKVQKMILDNIDDYKTAITVAYD